MKFLVTIFVLIFFVTGCSDPFQYNANEINLSDDETNINRKNVDRILNEQVSDTLRFAVIADTHHSYENLEDFVKMVNDGTNIDFVITVGDISNFGIQTEYRETNNRLKELKVPYVTVIGNHDLLGRGKELFEKMFGDRNLSFSCKGIRFILIDTNSREYNFNGLIPDLNWLNVALADTFNIDQIFVMSHVPPYSEDFDNDLEVNYAQILSGSGITSSSIHGHENRSLIHQPYFDGIDYVQVDDMANRAYLLVTAYDKSFQLEPKTF